MTIVRRGSKFRVVSEKGKNLGESGSKEGAVKRLKQVEWFKHHSKCIVDPDLVKGNAGMQQYVPVIFQVQKPQDKEGQKLDFPSSTKQMELRDVKQPEFPSTPFTGEAYSQSFHNPRPSNDKKDGTHSTIHGGPPGLPYNPVSFKGDPLGPDTQFKGSDYVPDDFKKKARANASTRDRKSIMIAGKKVVIMKGSEGSDNTNFQDYPLDRGKDSREFDPNEERQKRTDWINEQKTKEKVKAYEDAKRNYSPGNGPYGLAQGPAAYLGRAKNSKPIGEYTKEYPGAKVTFNQPIDPTKKPKKVFVHLTEQGQEVKAKRVDKSKGIMKLILQYTQNQPLAAGFKPLLAHLVKVDDKDEEEAEKAMPTGEIAEKISATSTPKGPSSKSRLRLMERAAKEKTENSSDDVSPHPDFGKYGGYKGDTSKLGKGNRPNPIEGGIGDKLQYKDVDQNELGEGIKVEQEHVGKDPDKDEDEKRVAAADIAMDHLEEDDKYYSHLAEMERTAKEEDKNETKKKKLLKIDQATKSFVFRGKRQ